MALASSSSSSGSNGLVRPKAAAAEALLRLLRAATHWVGSSLGRRFVGTSLALLLVIQLAGFLVIDASLHQHAHDALPEQLAMGTRSVQSLVDWRGGTLIEGARLLAADYGFRSAVMSNDRETIASVLSNHGARIGASELALLGPDFVPLAVAEGSRWETLAQGAPLAGIAARATQAGSASEITVIAGMPRQVVLVPMKAPTLVAWVLVYFPLPAAFADDVHRLSAVDLTLLSRTHPDAPWSVSLSRLPDPVAAELSRQDWAMPAHGTGGMGLLDRAVGKTAPTMTEIPVGPQQFGVRPLWLTAAPHATGGVPEPEVLALLSVSVDQALRPPRDLQLALLATTLLGFLAFGIGSAYTARRITTPLKALAAAAERLGSGDYGTPIASIGSHDEVGDLARSFEQMRNNVASKQAQIVQSEKLASIGQLAAGVAHEINNPIGFVFSNFGMLDGYLLKLFKLLAAYEAAERGLAGTPAALKLQRLRHDIELDYLKEDIPALMSESTDGLKRVRKIVQDLKDFSHVDGRLHWETVDLHAGLDSTLNIVNNEVKYKADVIKQYGALPPVECLPSELNQVFMNLMLNAAHAIGPQRGSITLRTGVDNTTAPREAWVEVADNGSGIAPDDLKRIFDPFFTTKAVGQGTGLGLSLSYGIVNKHGGRIEVQSEVGRGTTFRVCIPLKRPA